MAVGSSVGDQCAVEDDGFGFVDGEDGAFDVVGEYASQNAWTVGNEPVARLGSGGAQGDDECVEAFDALRVAREP